MRYNKKQLLPASVALVVVAASVIVVAAAVAGAVAGYVSIKLTLKECF